MDPAHIGTISPIAKPASIVVVNGNVWASPPAPPEPGGPSALALDGDRILAVGSDEEVRALADSAATVVDAAGGAVLPGFNDAHVHFLNGARNLANLDLSEETTVEGILARIRQFGATHPERDWLLGRGWFYAVFPGGMPTRELLDQAIPDRPVAMEAYDSHTTWVNSAGLVRLGVTRATPNPDLGEIQRDQAGRATGILKEAAMQLVDRALPKRSTAEDLVSLREAVALAHRSGLTSVQEAGADLDQFSTYEAYRGSGGPPFRIRIGLEMRPGMSMADWDKQLAELDAATESYRSDAFIRSGIVKAFADGVIESGTAAMLEPYEGMSSSDQGAFGYPQWDFGELGQAVRVADQHGWQVQIHAIGDGAVRAALDAFEQAAAINGRRDARHRIEHIETVSANDIPRFGALGVIASMQPYHADPEPAQLELYTSKIGRERASRGWPWAAIRRTGGRLAFGSDWPIVSFDPFLGLNSAVNRTTRDGRPPGGWLPEQRLALGDALAAYTTGASWAEFGEQRKGAIRPGMAADIVLLDLNLRETPATALVNVRVRATIVAGQLVFHA